MLDLKQINVAASGAVPLPEVGRVVLFADDAGGISKKGSDGVVQVLAQAGVPRVAVVTVTAPAANATASVAHGIAGGIASVVGFTAVAQGATQVIAPQNNTAANTFTAYLTATTAVVSIASNQGGNVVGKPVKFVIWYVV